MIMWSIPTEDYSRFLVQADYDNTMILDREEKDTPLGIIPAGLLTAALKVAFLVNRRDPDARVEVTSSGMGLAMAGLLRVYGINVLEAHVWDHE